MERVESKIPGCYEIRPHIHKDERGVFVKTFHVSAFASMGMCTNYAEEYYSVSNKGVIRGMHFQLPPHDHIKLVYCTDGAVMDVIVDLRKGSPTFGKHASFKLSSEKANMIYIPKGIAHGFCVLSERATMIYKVTSVYAQESDCGIRWDSAGICWPIADPILSVRDQRFSSLEQFESPFFFEEG